MAFRIECSFSNWICCPIFNQNLELILTRTKSNRLTFVRSCYDPFSHCSMCISVCFFLVSCADRRVGPSQDTIPDDDRIFHGLSIELLIKILKQHTPVRNTLYMSFVFFFCSSSYLVGGETEDGTAIENENTARRNRAG